MAHARLAAIIDDGCDSFDDDLDWILEKLNDRAGGSFGVIVRLVEGAAKPALMARTAATDKFPDSALERIQLELRDCVRKQPITMQQLAISSEPMLVPGLPGGEIRLLYMVFQPAPGIDIVAAVGRPRSSFSLLQGMVARRLHPVLFRYIRLWWMHRTERRRADAFDSAIDIAELGVALLDRRGQLLYENAYVRRILEEADGMRRMGRSLLPTDAGDVLRLQSAIQQALHFNMASRDELTSPAPLLLLRRGEDKRALILTVISHRRRAVDPCDAAAILYVLHPERDMRRCLAPVYRIYGLSPAEARLVTELLNGANLQEAATDMGISLATVRAQLKQVFEKTRTNRQAELVRIMLASAVRSSVSLDFSLLQ